MALRQKGLLFRAEAAATLSATPLAGESFLVTDVYCTNKSGGNQFAVLITQGARVGEFRIGGFGGSHLAGPNEAARGVNLLAYMRRHLGFTGYPVPQGYTFTINISTGTADIFFVADSYDSTDVKVDQPYGPAAVDYTYAAYGTNLNAITVTGYNKLDNNQNDSVFPRFPFAAVGQGLVPAGYKASILLIGGQAMGRFVSSGNTATTNYMRLRKGIAPSATLLDRGDVGYPFFGVTPGAGTDYTSSRQVIPSSDDNSGFQLMRKEDFIIPQLDFVANEEFQVQVQTVIVGTGQLNAGDIDVWTLQRLFKAT